MRRTSLIDLPFWPRLLSREEAARYVGTSPDTFDDEVRSGIWPAGLRRGQRQGRTTWDRLALDRAADRASGLVEGDHPPSPAQVADTGREAARVAALAAAEAFGNKPKRRNPD